MLTCLQFFIRDFSVSSSFNTRFLDFFIFGPRRVLTRLQLVTRGLLFRNLRIALLIIIISILGIAGCIWALYITKTPLNVGSYTGIIMIVGIIAENAIFTVNQFMATYKDTDDIRQSVDYAILRRIRPNLMTALQSHGVDDDLLTKIAHGNWLRVLRKTWGG